MKIYVVRNKNDLTGLLDENHELKYFRIFFIKIIFFMKNNFKNRVLQENLTLVFLSSNNLLLLYDFKNFHKLKDLFYLILIIPK